jgi:hypothetical protein
MELSTIFYILVVTNSVVIREPHSAPRLKIISTCTISTYCRYKEPRAYYLQLTSE